MIYFVMAVRDEDRRFRGPFESQEEAVQMARQWLHEVELASQALASAPTPEEMAAKSDEDQRLWLANKALYESLVLYEYTFLAGSNEQLQLEWFTKS